MNNPDSTTHKPRTAAEIAQELTVLTKALEEKKSIEERLVQIQAELAQAQQKEAREKSQKAASDRTKLVRRWYLHILLGEDW